MSPSGLVTALASLEPENFYSGAPVKRASWAIVIPKNRYVGSSKSNCWITIRDVICCKLFYSRGFSQTAIELVKKYNMTTAGKKHPIVLMTPPPAVDVPNRPMDKS